jgi:ribonuclease P protein component
VQSLKAECSGALAFMNEAVIGALLPKRWAKRAVTRNAIKRQIFQVVQEFESSLSGFACVVRLRHGFERTEFVSASSSALKEAARHELVSLFASAAARLPRKRHG